MDGLQPTFDINGNNNGWGNGWGALVGGAVGGAVGSAWNGNRWNNGGNCGCNGGNQFLMDSLSGLRTDVGSISRDQLMQTADLQSTNCQGFGGLNSAIERVGGQVANGQSRTEAAIYATSLQAQLGAKDNTITTLNASHANEVQALRNAFALQSAIDSCCCTTQRTIEGQGCATRELIQAEGCATRAAIDRNGQETRALISQLDRENLLRDMAAKDAKIGQLEAQIFNGALAAGTQQQVRNDMQGMLTTILGHMALRPSTTTAAAAA